MDSEFTKMFLQNLKNYIVNVKREIEEDGLIATADEIIERLDNSLLSVNKENESKSCLSGKEDALLNEMEHEHSDSVDADGTCLQCGATNLI